MSQPPPFVVFSLPRSRSTWLSVFLSTPDRRCGHDIGPTCDSIRQFTDRLRGELVGACETGAAFAWRLIRDQLPDARFVVIRRDPAKVVRSLEVFGIVGQEGEMWGRARELDVIAAQPDVLTLEYDELRSPQACADLYEHCTGRVLPFGWWAQLEAMNIQTDMDRQLGLLMRRRPQIEALKAEARAALEALHA